MRVSGLPDTTVAVRVAIDDSELYFRVPATVSYVSSTSPFLVAPSVNQTCGVCGIFLPSYCFYDCNGDLRGDAQTDSCGVCSGGNSGVPLTIRPVTFYLLCFAV
jgi:hypothetical protein